MKRIISLLLCACMAMSVLMLCAPETRALEVPSLTRLIHNGDRRRFVSAMLSFHLSENTVVQETLENGYSALFLFDGCSDNMDDDRLSDLSYYRVSGVCIVLRLNKQGQPYIAYFNDNCSTLPDRPLDYTLWELEEIGAVGPATVCDGTYELYSVYHAGAYEALHLRTSYADGTVSAIYMTPEGYAPSRATYINIHTRTGNHILREAVWSAGCMLVGDGDFAEFEALIDATYDQNYPEFLVDQKVGTVTINRLPLRSAMCRLYQDEAAVDTILTGSRCDAPKIYLERCSALKALQETTLMEAVRTVELRSLPCEPATDPRSVSAGRLSRGSTVDICGSIVNTEGELWYQVELLGENPYVPAEAVRQVTATEEASWWNRLIAWLAGARK